MPGLLDGIVFCKDHKCPYITLPDEEEPVMVCAYDHINDSIGFAQITALEENDGRAYLVFEDEYKMPLLCPCCAGKDNIIVDKEENNLEGLYLVGMTFYQPEGKDHWAVSMFFSDDPDNEPLEGNISVALESAVGITKIKA